MSAFISSGPRLRDTRDDRHDAELLDLVRQGDERAFASLMDRWWQPLVLYCRGVVKTDAACDDVVQEAFVRLWNRRSSWRPKSSVAAILYTIVRNRALNELRLLNTRQRHLSIGRTVLNRRVYTPAEEAEGEEFRAALDRAIAELSPRRREVLLLCREERLSHAEVAEITGLTPQTIANYLFRALEELRSKLEPYLRA